MYTFLFVHVVNFLNYYKIKIIYRIYIYPYQRSLVRPCVNIYLSHPYSITKRKMFTRFRTKSFFEYAMPCRLFEYSRNMCRTRRCLLSESIKQILRLCVEFVGNFHTPNDNVQTLNVRTADKTFSFLDLVFLLIPFGFFCFLHFAQTIPVNRPRGSLILPLGHVRNPDEKMAT